jgi:multidrug transporter EmrE-like cation transporter
MRPSDWGLLLSSAALTMAANLLLRTGLTRAGGLPSHLSQIPAGLLRLGLQPLFDAGLALYMVAMLVWFRILSMQAVSLAYPVVLSLNLLFVTLGAVVLLGESLTVAKVVGLAVIVSGIFILSRG